MLGLQKLSESVRDYAYLILTSQTSTRGQIIGHEARNLGPVHMILGQLIAPEQLTDPGVNFA